MTDLLPLLFGELRLPPLQVYQMTPAEIIHTLRGYNKFRERERKMHVRDMSVLVAELVAPHVKRPKDPPWYYDRWTGADQKSPALPKTREEKIADFHRMMQKVKRQRDLTLLKGGKPKDE